VPSVCATSVDPDEIFDFDISLIADGPVIS